MIDIERVDHFVLTVASVARSCEFYARVLGLKPITFGPAEAPRHALAFGNQKINLHPADAVPDPNVLKPTPGSADFCLITSTPMTSVIAHLGDQEVAIVLGPVIRTGAMGPMQSVYLRDPDLNLIEVANYLEGSAGNTV